MSPDHHHHVRRVGHGHSNTAVTTDSGTGPAKVAGVPCNTNSRYAEGQGHHSAPCNSSKDIRDQGYHNPALGFIKVVQCKKQCVHAVGILLLMATCPLTEAFPSGGKGTHEPQVVNKMSYVWVALPRPSPARSILPQS